MPTEEGNQLHPRLHQNSVSIQEDSNRGHAFGMMTCVRDVIRINTLCTQPILFLGWAGTRCVWIHPDLPSPVFPLIISIFDLLWSGGLSATGHFRTTIFNIIVPPVSESKSTSNKLARLASSFSPDNSILLFLPQKYYFRFHVDKSPIATVNDRTSSVRYKQGC